MKQRVILVHRKTRLEELVSRFNTWSQARFYLEHSDADPADYLAEHDLYNAKLQEAMAISGQFAPIQKLERSLLAEFKFRRGDVIVVVGQDGLVANTLKYAHGLPVLGVNPDPSRWDGVLLRFKLAELSNILSDTLNAKVMFDRVRLAEALTNDGQRMLAVNDLFIGPKSHGSARYELSWANQSEIQSSSGIIISTGFGSTGWYTSIMTGAMAITGKAISPDKLARPWDANRLSFCVREPFPSVSSSTEMVYGEIHEQAAFSVASLMPESGVIFSDGMEQDAIAFNSGTRVEVRVASEEGLMVA
ncbi:sugar kinase [Umboniibacter marinipuniceus]|uniref:Sugar kinase n=1 Tax=Umboniibacter marinipuniceus TaxID=569599 RepID=A0A3M0AJE7_9GAMM|nr:sugar kinase [Umboniibacter marinipuniceus]RMA82695.1 hypothetical protein DFR27_0652 [Umboniibacter marinipuniceus]